MPSRFAEAEQMVSDAIDVEMGERTRITPMAKSEYLAASADSDRNPVFVTGIPDFTPKVAQVQDKSTYDGMLPNMSGDNIHVSYDITKLEAQRYRPKHNDIITLLDRPGQPQFRVTREPEDDGIGRVICICVPSKR